MHFINLPTKLNLNGTYALKTFRNFQVLVQYLEQRKILIITMQFRGYRNESKTLLFQLESPTTIVVMES